MRFPTHLPLTYQRFGKRLLDLIFFFAVLPITLPIILLCALALRIQGVQPFHRQVCLGKSGRVFFMFKLRTMVRGADQPRNEYLGDDPALAESLQLKVGDSLNLLVNTAEGTVDEQPFSVRGIFSTGSSTYDKGLVLLSLAKAQSFSGVHRADPPSCVLVRVRSRNSGCRR